MRIGMLDLDRTTQHGKFPNLALMKLSAFHKRCGDDVVWYDGSYCDIVYVVKVFSFTPDYEGELNAGAVVKGGSGYAINLVDGKEVYDKQLDPNLPYEIEHIYPDYSLYEIEDTAYGFLQRGCPRACPFCHVKGMQGTKPHKVADLSEFWSGQKNIVLLDPNITTFCGWKDVFQQLIDSGAVVDFSQGLDIRALTDEKLDMLMQVKTRGVHFAWDRYEDGDLIKDRLKALKDKTGWDKHGVTVYVLCNYDTTFEQDFERVQFIRELGFQPYVMTYNKRSLKRGCEINKLARWANWPPFCWSFDDYEEFKCKMYKTYKRK